VVLCYEYLTELPFLLPPILVFGVKSGAPPLYWLYAGLGFLALPLVPLTLASLLSIVVMRFTASAGVGIC
jgi:ABC-2 type transport system permease protein